jgi:hypothetical protein
MLLDSRDPEALGRRLGELLATPPAGDSLRTLVEGLTWECSTDTLEAVLNSLARG